MRTSTVAEVLDQVVASLRASLGENLHSCILYGSAVRGGLVPNVSDINLIVILNESTPEAHLAIARAIPSESRIDPFVLGRIGLNRSMRAFASKFQSVRRNYRVLYGTDPMLDFNIDPSLERFLCEQALRNLRLRFVRAFILFGESRKRYQQFVQRHDAALFVHLSELLRLNGVEVPKEFPDRIPIMEKTLGLDGSPLRKLLVLKETTGWLASDEIQPLHAGIIAALDRAIRWLEEKWPS